MDPHSFFFQALVFLAAAVLFVPLAKRSGLGSVLGYLIAGIIIGPSVLGFVGAEGQDLMHFAEFGVVMMLFLIGLELEPQLLWRLRKSILGLGGLQVAISSAVLGGLAMLFGLPWTVALAIGLTLSLSSTAIVLQTMNEKGLMKTASGQNAFSVLLFQDIAVIPMLALLPLLAIYPKAAADGAHHQTTWVEGLAPGWHALVVLGSVAGIILAGRYLIRPLLRLVAGIRMREIFTATALLLVVAITVLMTQVGLSPALGTFLAGVVLASSEYRHELESDIEPFKGLLLGLFFMTVGASVNFSLILENPLLILGLVLGVMAVKTAVLLTLGRVFRIGTGQNILFSFALSQVGEFAFVLLSFTVQEGVMPAQVSGVLVAVIALTMAMTPLVLMLAERVLLPRVGTRAAPPGREEDAIDEANPVIVAGFGEFGHTVGRFLRANRVQATFLDLNSDRVDLLRKMGFKVYYGDASRYELLQSAGAGHAKLMVVAIGDPEKRLELIETARKHFPNLRLLVRSANRFDSYDLMNAGMMHVYRETLDSAMRMGAEALTMLGHRRYRAQRAAQMFSRHDESTLKQLAAIRNQQEYISAATGAIEELERTIQADILDNIRVNDSEWDSEPLRREFAPNAASGPAS